MKKDLLESWTYCLVNQSRYKNYLSRMMQMKKKLANIADKLMNETIPMWKVLSKLIILRTYNADDELSDHKPLVFLNNHSLNEELMTVKRL